MEIIADDFTFTTNDWGKQVAYGTGRECNSNSMELGQIRMSLNGTDFHFHSSVSIQCHKKKKCHKSLFFTVKMETLCSRFCADIS